MNRERSSLLPSSITVVCAATLSAASAAADGPPCQRWASSTKCVCATTVTAGSLNRSELVADPFAQKIFYRRSLLLLAHLINRQDVVFDE